MPDYPLDARVSRRLRGFSTWRGQRNCKGCGHYLPMAWPADALCQACQEKAKAKAEQ